MNRSRLALPLAVALLSACPSGDDDDVEPFACELGLVDPGGEWVAIDADGATSSELIFGFQGFLWVDAALRGDADTPERANVILRVTIDGFPPIGRTLTDVVFATDGERQSETLAIRLDNSEGPGRYAGLEAEIVVRATGMGREAVCAATVLLVDDDPCIDTDGGEPICPGGDDDDSAGDDDDSGVAL